MGKPVLIVILSLILQESEKMGRLVRRYEFLEADLAVVAVLEDPSQEDIRSRAERMPLEDIIN